MAKTGNYQIPFQTKRFTQNGEEDCMYLKDYVSPYMQNKVEWFDNFEMVDTFVYEGFSRGRSSAVFNFTNKSGTFNGQMFMKEMDELIRTGINITEFHGKITFCKRGTNYGIKFLELVNV